MAGDYKNNPNLAGELDIYKSTLAHHVAVWPNSDPYIAACAKAMLLNWDKMEPIVAEGFLFRRNETGHPVNPKLYPNLTERALWWAIESEDPENWPHAYAEEPAVTKVLQHILPPKHDIDSLYENDFSRNTIMRSNQANPGEKRAIPTHALINLYPDRFPGLPTIEEPGTSTMHILKALAMGLELPASELHNITRDGTLVWDQAASLAYSALRREHRPLGPSVGIDEWPLGDDTKKWAEICSITPGEIVLPPKEVRIVGRTALQLTPKQLHRLIDAESPEQVAFKWGDVTDTEQMKEFFTNEKGETQRSDIILLATMMQQQSQEKREEILAHALKHVSDNGIIIIQDFVKVDPNNPHQLIFPEDIYESKWLYNTLVFDVLNPQAGWQLLFAHETGRCLNSVVGPGGLMVNGEFVPIKERLDQYAA